MNNFRSYVGLATRALCLAIFLGCLAIFGEFAFVLIARMFEKPIQFTSSYALIIFSGLAGFLPLSETPNRISSFRLSMTQRSFLLFEITLLVAIAVAVSTRYMLHKEGVVENLIAISVGAYFLALVVSLIGNRSIRRH